MPAELIKNGDTFDIMRLDGLDPMIGNIEALNYFLSSNEDCLRMEQIVIDHKVSLDYQHCEKDILLDFNVTLYVRATTQLL